jgi:hypothetical protein
LEQDEVDKPANEDLEINTGTTSTTTAALESDTHLLEIKI